MNARGVFVAPGQSIRRDGTVLGAPPDPEHLIFWVSGLCSPWRSFGYRARAYLAAARSGDPERQKTVVNTQLGELFRIGGEAPEWQEVKQRSGGYAMGEVPAGEMWLTCGVDVQKDRLVFAVRAWSYGLESWLIKFGEIWGDTALMDVWDLLRSGVIEQEYGNLRLRKCVVDSGYKPGEESAEHIVYSFCRTLPEICVPAKGHDKLEKPFYAMQIDVRANGKLIKKGLQLWHLDSDSMKSFVHGRLRQPPGSAGAWHLPHDVTEDYCQQLVAEARVSKASGRAVWVKIRKSNHALDCEAMNVAAIHMLGGHMMMRPAPPEPPKSDLEKQVAQPPSALAPVQQRWQSAPPGNWTTGWRK
jgi:phage terminase large subunit GpA-like protein